MSCDAQLQLELEFWNQICSYSRRRHLQPSWLHSNILNKKEEVEKYSKWNTNNKNN